MNPSIYIHKITGKVFKILPLREEELKGRNMYLSDYIESLVKELIGSCKTFPILADNADYLSVINTLQYLADTPGTLNECRSEVIKMCKMLNVLEESVGDAHV